ncbi:MAG: hypothetical protein ACUZ9M_06065 [Candidatus Scalindua sp.]
MTPTTLTVQDTSTERLSSGKATYITPRHRYALEETEYIPKQTKDTSLFQISEDKPNKIKISDKEKILEWWMGTVTKIYEEQRYFEAHLEDNDGIESIAEFDIYKEIKQDVYKGSRFVFSIFTKSLKSSIDTTNRIEFIPPQIWTEEEDNEVKEIYK